MVGRDAASVWKRRTSGLKANIKIEAADVRSGMSLRRRCWDEGEGEVLLSTRGRYERPFNGEEWKIQSWGLGAGNFGGWGKN